MTRIVTVVAITENEAADLVQRPGAHPCVDDRLAGEVRTKIGELRNAESPEIALATVGENEWVAYVMDDPSAADSGIFRITLRETSQFGVFP